MTGLLAKTARVLREQGLGAVFARARVRLLGDDGIRRSLVVSDDAIAVDWRTPHPAVAAPAAARDAPWTVSWIMSPPGLNSGGHQNIFRFIAALQAAGHRNRIHLYSNIQPVSAAQTRAMLASSDAYPDVDAEILEWSGDVPDDTDALIATGWETAYPSFRATSTARRFYFVQDFEPWFTAVGSESILAEATYRFGFRAITAGRWLSGRLRDEYGMTADHFDFGSDPEHYRVEGEADRDQVFFYARRATERRGFELGILALEIVARERPEVVINIVGDDVRSLPIRFRHVNRHGLGLRELGELYNRCSVGLVLSFTNCSLLPLELLGAGTIPVVNDAPNNRMVVENPHIAWTSPIPRAIADAILEQLDHPDPRGRALDASRSVRSADWSIAKRQFLDAFESGMR